MIDIQHSSNAKNKFLVRTSYLQIYNESISDLLKPERKNLQIREDKKKGVFVEDLSEVCRHFSPSSFFFSLAHLVVFFFPVR